MKPEIKERWLKALRSSKYQQGRGRLRTGSAFPHGKDAFCCLGVLCDITSPNEWSYIWTSGKIGSQVASELGVELYQTKLITMNDKELASFEEIADWIEANIPNRE